jgi:uncharacterized protein YjiS (DUF1127 family)
MGTIQLSPGSIGFPKGSDRSGLQTEALAAKDVTGFGKTRRNRKMSVLGYVWDLMIRWNRHTKMRRVLLEMDIHQLRDIGITVEQARAEANKSFWRLLP